MSPPVEVWKFGRRIDTVLQRTLANDFIGTYFLGSVALGGYVAGESDIDIVAVCRRSINDQTRQLLVDDLLEQTVTCPARGLEFTLYRLEVASSPPLGADFEVNVNGGPRMDRLVHLSAADEPGFWYALDRAIAHRTGVAISGPIAAEVFADVPRPVLLDALVASMWWHREHEKATLYSVLNASRAWRFAVENVLVSKLEGADWARSRWPRPTLIEAAVDLRHGRPAKLDGGEVDAFREHVELILASAV